MGGKIYGHPFREQGFAKVALSLPHPIDKMMSFICKQSQIAGLKKERQVVLAKC